MPLVYCEVVASTISGLVLPGNPNMRMLSIALCLLLAPWGVTAATGQEPVFVPGAQPAAEPPPGAKATGRGLKIYILAGRDGRNRLSEGVTSVPIIEIRDRNDIPLEGIPVTIETSSTGAGARFADGSARKSFKTNLSGQVVADGWTANGQTGKFSVLVTATDGDQVAKTSFFQFNTNETLAEAEAKRRGAWRKWAYIGAGVVGGVVAAVVLTGSSGSDITVSPGPIVIGGR